MSAILDACGNDTGSVSISKAEDNLSNSDGPLIQGCARQNSCNSVRVRQVYASHDCIIINQYIPAIAVYTLTRIIPMLRSSSENVNRTAIVSSHAMSGIDEKSTKRRYRLWTLTCVLAIIGLCNLFLNITVIAVLRISQGMEAMEVIPDENLVKFYGKTDLDKVRYIES